VVSAKLFLYLPAATSLTDRKIWIDISFWVMDADTPTLKKKQNVSAELLPDVGCWVKIELQDITHEWFKAPSTNMGLEINVNTENGVSIPVGVQHEVENNAPYLQLKIQDSWSLEQDREAANDHCHVEPFKVCIFSG
jgi:hypothetical protein